MALVSKNIPNFINGVSQQPPALRLAGQGEIQENGLSDVVAGLKKRPPTAHVNDLKMKETIEVVNDHIKDVDVRAKSQIQNILDTEIKDIDSRINSQFEQISKDLKEIKDIINQIESSKIGKKIFK